MSDFWLICDTPTSGPLHLARRGIWAASLEDVADCLSTTKFDVGRFPMGWDLFGFPSDWMERFDLICDVVVEHADFPDDGFSAAVWKAKK